MKTISILSYNTRSIGIKVIVDAMCMVLEKKFIVRVVRDNSYLNKNDIVIPYGPKETFYALRKGYNVPLSLMVDYYTLSIKNSFLFLIRKGYLFKRKGYLFNKYYIRWILLYLYYFIIEAFIFKKCKNIMLVSQSDINKLKKRFPQNNYYCVPNGIVLPEENMLKKKNVTDKISLGILSVWTYGTFLEAKWFIDLFWPKILKEFPNAEIVICGKHATNEMMDYFNTQTNVRFIGEVNNLSTFFNQIDIYLATKTIGCGILNKVLDAMAYKKLVIGIKESFTGFTYMSNSFIVCDNVNDYINLLKKYSQNSKEYDYIVENAYNNIIKYNNWGINYNKFIEQLISNNVIQ